MIILISIASLANVNNITPNNIPSIPHFDKIVHFLMYSTLTFIFLWENFSRHNYHVITNRVFLIIILIIVVGITMELLQNTITDYRSGNINDTIANTFGLLIGWIGFIITRKISFLKNVIFKPL
ncbi:MAG: VanZ family protein [Marinilabiliaceae bacterium]|nr:VanZ family protein [Marinilabiliaceae bacterium]